MAYNLDRLQWEDAPGDWFGFGHAIVANLPDFDPKDGLHLKMKRNGRCLTTCSGVSIGRRS
nr:MAG TPA: hypothetical protein [Caudoviricetes sp.]